MLDCDKNIIITGIPRSGTTLLTSLIDYSPNAVALHESAWQADWPKMHAHASATDFVQWFSEDFVRLRNNLLNHIPVPDRRLEDGSSPTNYYTKDSHQKTRKNYQILPLVRLGLDENFTLAIKHNGLFLSVLPELINTNRFKIIAIIRNAEDVMTSWRRLDLPVSSGKLPAACFYWEEMRELTNRNMDLHEKQLLMYHLMKQRIEQASQDITIIHYEDLVAGKIPAMLSSINPDMKLLLQSLTKLKDR